MDATPDTRRSTSDEEQAERPSSASSGGAATPRPTSDSDGTAATTPSGLDAGGHDPAPPSEDPVTQEARDGIQHEFDTLEATVSSDAVWDEAARRADQEPAPGTPTGDAEAGSSAAGGPPAESPAGEG